MAAAWREEFAHAQYAWLSAYSGRPIAWSPALRDYFTSHFVPTMRDSRVMCSTSVSAAADSR